MPGWNLTVSLIAKHFGKFGETIAESLAAFDPETATEVDRDRLATQLREIALRLAQAKNKYSIEQKEAVDLAALIAKDQKAAEILIAKFERNEIDEAVLNEFASNLEELQSRLPREEKDAADAKELVDALQEILGNIEKNLAEFDRHAKEMLNHIALAQADNDRQKLRQAQQDQLTALKSGLTGSSTALGALAKKAASLRAQADAAKIVADIGQKPLDRIAAVEEARRLAAGGADTKAETAVERMRRVASLAEKPTTDNIS